MPKRQSQASEVLLTIAEIARHFALPESTARYYCKRFAAFIPSSGEGRRKRYRPETIEIIQAVLEGMRTARTAGAVEEALAQRFPRNAECLRPRAAVLDQGALDQSSLDQSSLPAVSAEFVSQAAMSLMERQTSAMEGMAMAIGVLARRQEALEAISEQTSAALGLLARRDDDLRALAEKAAAAEAESADLRREVDKLRVLLLASEKTQQADVEQLRDWMGRLVRGRLSAAGK